MPRYANHTNDDPIIKEQLKALQQNDPTVTIFGREPVSRDSFLMHASPPYFPTPYGQRLGAALQGNTVVSKLILNLSLLLSKTDARTGSFKSVSKLLTWMEEHGTISPLRDVTLTFCHMDHDDSQTLSDLLQMVIEALTENACLQVFHSAVPIPWHMLVDFVTSNRLHLQSFRLDTRGYVNYEAATTGLVPTAQALSALPALTEVALPAHDALVRITLPSLHATLCDLTLYYQLQYYETINAPQNAALLSNVFKTCLQLKRVELHHLELNDGNPASDSGVTDGSNDDWTVIASGLHANTSIERLDLIACTFAKAAAAAFIQTMQERRHSIRQLRLRSCKMVPTTTIPPVDGGTAVIRTNEHINDASMGAELAQLLIVPSVRAEELAGAVVASDCTTGTSTTALSHGVLPDVRIDVNTTMGQLDGAEHFFRVLTGQRSTDDANKGRVAVRSLHLDEIRRYEGGGRRRGRPDANHFLNHILPPFLPTTVHLQQLTLDLEGFSVDALSDELAQSVRANGSLHLFQINGGGVTDGRWGREQNDRALRTIAACTTRNRLLPEMLRNTQFEKPNQPSSSTNSTANQVAQAQSQPLQNADTDTAAASPDAPVATPALPAMLPPPPVNLFPALGVVGMPAEPMAPSTLLVGLLAGSTCNSLGPSTTTRTLLGKRKAPDSVADNDCTEE